jgi:ketosteroid isomerase-like protein
VKSLVSIAFAILGLCIVTKAQTRDITKELVTLEQNFNDALVRSDWKTVEQLYADDVTFTNSDGSVSHKSDTIDELRSGNTKFDSIEISDVKVKDLGSVAVVTGKLSETGHYKTIDLTGTYRFTNVWAKQAGRWKLVAGQEVLNTPEQLSSNDAELDRLKFYIGDWDYSELYEKSTLFPNAGRNKGRWSAQIGPQGHSIIHAFVSHGTGDNYEGIEVMTWDQKGKVYRDHSLWYDSPDQWSYVGHFEGDTLVYHAEFEQDGKYVKFRSETRPRLGGGFTIDEFASVDGGPEQKLLRGTAVPH